MVISARVSLIPAVRTECKNILTPLSELTDIPVAGQVIASRSDIQVVSRKAGVASANYRESVIDESGLDRSSTDSPCNRGIHYNQEIKPFTGRVSVSVWLGSR